MNKAFRKIGSAVRCALLCAALMLPTVLPTAAVVLDYTGPLDNYTGRPQTEAADGAAQTAEAVSGSFDRERQMFVYEVTAGSRVYCSACDGMVTAGPVQLGIAEGMEAGLYRDGVLLGEEELRESGWTVRTPGAYTLEIVTGGQRYQPLRFLLVGEVTGALSEYRMPAGFAATEVLLDGEPVAFDPGVVDMGQEGTYEIAYCQQTTWDRFRLRVRVDHTPPTLALGAVQDGVARGPVDLGDLEPGAEIEVELDGRPISEHEWLTQSGSYVVRVTDEAGNSSVYKFVIRVYFNTSSLMFFTLLVAVIVAVLAYLIYVRRRMRVS